MWICVIRDGKTPQRCSCHKMLEPGNKKAQPYYCQYCNRVWNQVACDWWSNIKRRKPHELVNGPQWKTQLVEVPVFESVSRKYLAVHEDSGLGVLLDSVSDVLKMIGGDTEALDHWASMVTLAKVIEPWAGPVDETLKHLKKDNGRGGQVTRQKFSELILALPHEVQTKYLTVCLTDLLDQFDAALDQRYKSAELAAEYGTRAHELIQKWFERGGTWDYVSPDGEEYTTDITLEEKPVQNCIAAFMRLWAREKFEFYAAEQTVADVELGVAGTLDALVTDPNGCVILLDWKTSNSLKDKFLVQVHAYARMAEKAGLVIDRGYIVRFDKATAALQVVPVFINREQYAEGCRDWGATLHLKRWSKRAANHLKDYATEPISA